MYIILQYIYTKIYFFGNILNLKYTIHYTFYSYLKQYILQ